MILPTLTKHARERMDHFGIGSDEVYHAVNFPLRWRLAGAGAINYWHRRPDGRFVRVTFDTIDEVVITACLVAPEFEPIVAYEVARLGA